MLDFFPVNCQHQLKNTLFHIVPFLIEFTFFVPSGWMLSLSTFYIVILYSMSVYIL